MIFFLDIPADYSKVELKVEHSTGIESDFGKEKNISHYSAYNLTLSSSSYSYTKSLDYKGRIPASEGLKRAMFRMSSKSIGRILADS